MRLIIFLGFLFLAACSNIPEPTERPTLPPTLTPIPTVTPTPEPVQEIPLDDMLALIEAIQMVEPDATYETAPCQEHEGYDLCVTSVNFCPGGAECLTLAIHPLDYLWSDSEIALLSSVKSKVVGDHIVILRPYQVPSEGFFLTVAETIVYFCLFGSNPYPESIPWPLAAWPLSQRASDKLVENDLVMVGRGQQASLESCI